MLVCSKTINRISSYNNSVYVKLTLTQAEWKGCMDYTVLEGAQNTLVDSYIGILILALPNRVAHTQCGNMLKQRCSYRLIAMFTRGIYMTYR